MICNPSVISAFKQQQLKGFETKDTAIINYPAVT
jgi:hypothetical protein